MLREDESYSSVDSETAKMINVLSGREIISEPEGGKTNVNDLMEYIVTTARAEGEKEERIKKETVVKETAHNMFNQGFRLDQALGIISYDENAIRGWWSEFENAPKLSV